MEKIEKKINGFLSAAIGSMIIVILVGLFFAVMPGLALSIMRWGITIILLLSGVAMIASDMQKGNPFSMFSTSLMGIFLVLMGIIIAIYPETLSIVTIAFGVYMILNSVMQLNIANQIRGTSAYTASLISNIIGLICGVIMIVHPGESTESIVMLAGILMIIYGISGLVDTFILKSRIKKVEKKVKKTVKNAKKTANKLIEEAEEAEIVDEKDK